MTFRISIHAPHTGRDRHQLQSGYQDGSISIHAPHTGRDHRQQRAHGICYQISIHAPHTGRDYLHRQRHIRVCGISIHAPHTGRDWIRCREVGIEYKFQSTRPIRGATVSNNTRHTGHGFQSTRPIRGATSRLTASSKASMDFNPRAPYGARQQKCIIYVLHFCNNRQLKHKNQQETSSVRTFF